MAWKIDAFAVLPPTGGCTRRGACTMVAAMQFPDSTFAALRIRADDADESHSWRRLLLLALVLTIAAASAGLLAGG